MGLYHVYDRFKWCCHLSKKSSQECRVDCHCVRLMVLDHCVRVMMLGGFEFLI